MQIGDFRLRQLVIGYVLNEQGTKVAGYEDIFSWYKYSMSIKLKMGQVIWKSIQKLAHLPSLTQRHDTLLRKKG